jgi:SNF2 family DNA or RNA helicase
MSTEALVTAVKGAREARMVEISRDEGEFFHSLETQGLKPHQMEGVLWMSAMYDCGCSCILGDEMGMGKTVQAISLISRIVRMNGDPILVIAPLAVLKGWEEEFHRWTPPSSALLFTYHPSAIRREELAKAMIETWKGGGDTSVVVLTTPALFVSDFEAINAHGGRWGLVVVDEAHTAKNSASIFSRHLQALDTESFLLLTGTIVHNNIEEELVHLLSFVLPSVAKEIPQSLFSEKEKKSHSGLFAGARPTDALENIAKILYCFMLRRLIRDTPGVSMPPKISCTVNLPQTPLQKQLYSTPGISKDLCDKHPFLALATNHNADLKSADLELLKGVIKHSNKILFLLHILPSLTAGNKHKVLIFSNSLGVLHMLGMVLGESEEYFVDLITGDVNDIEERKQRLDRFNTQEKGPTIMLLSTKAMGQGVQLTGADTVIFYDHHDNPQNDNQAEGRAYRITQRNPVLVLRLVTQNSKEAEAMESWVKEKREIQQWLEFTRAIATSIKKTPPSASEDPKTLRLSDEGVLQRLLMDRTVSGEWMGEWP